MENRPIFKQDVYSRHSSGKLIKNIILLDLIVSFVLYLVLIAFDPAVWLNEFFSPLVIFVVLTFLWGPVLMVVGIFAYIIRMTNISRIPLNSSLYDVITLPTIQYGPLKIIFPVIEEETLEENEVSKKDSYLK
ncbi:MAG: hypothetical protein JSW11_21145 [Candidatus Heimdallarchaeota archaeon]|nr:MAG: hypothetical protein JSW11_21145 [Candidatus Heimdallarchaeota archaeon]